MALSWILGVFVVYRLASLIAVEEGPYLPLGRLKNESQHGIFRRIRILAGVYDYGENGEPETNLARGLECPMCVGLYVSIFVAGLILVDRQWSFVVLGILGLAGVQTLLEEFIDALGSFRAQ